MNTVLRSLLPSPLPTSANGTISALREAMQNLALLGLWRAKFFEVGAFYGGTSLRLLYGLSRYSEDLDFSLLSPMADFSFQPYENSLSQELESFGLKVSFQSKVKSPENQIKSAFLKANTYQQLVLIEAPTEILAGINRQQTIKIKIEVDTNPPLGFDTELKYLLNPLPFPVRTYTLPNLFAGKMHAQLCRSWQTRVKGRDWYDFLWYVSFHPELKLAHLEERMRQSGHYTSPDPLTKDILHALLSDKIEQINIDSLREEVSPFVDDIRTLEGWSKELFIEAAKRIKIV
jgi:hypothetical protein